MTSIPQLAVALQNVLQVSAEQAAKSTQFIKRQRAFSAEQFVQTLVFGWLAQPMASYEQLVDVAEELGVSITPQGLQKRLTSSAADCLFQVLNAALAQTISSEALSTGLLERFSALLIHDSTTIALPDALASQYQGCGGSQGRVASALKAQVRLDLRSGKLDGPLLHHGRDNDKSKTFPQQPPAKSLLIRDLGYFKLAEFARIKQEYYWLSRYYTGTAVFDQHGRRSELAELLEQQNSDVVDMQVVVGVEQKLKCRLMAARVPSDVAKVRRENIKAQARKKGRTASEQALVMCGWIVLFSNATQEQMNVQEAVVLMRMRWQIELLFKLWKSEGHIDKSRRRNASAVLCEVYAKLIGMVLQHWQMLVSCWENQERSLVKLSREIRKRVEWLVGKVADTEQLVAALEKLKLKLCKVAGQTSRKKRPNAYKLLDNPPSLSLPVP